jgi:hypothetical protein
MNEFLLALWAMTAGHHQWERPAREPVAIVRPLETLGSARELRAGERRELQTAVDRMARCATGTLRLDRRDGWYVPEEKASGSCARLAAATWAPEE